MNEHITWNAVSYFRAIIAENQNASLGWENHFYNGYLALLLLQINN